MLCLPPSSCLLGHPSPLSGVCPQSLMCSATGMSPGRPPLHACSGLSAWLPLALNVYPTFHVSLLKPYGRTLSTSPDHRWPPGLHRPMYSGRKKGPEFPITGLGGVWVDGSFLDLPISHFGSRHAQGLLC